MDRRNYVNPEPSKSFFSSNSKNTSSKNNFSYMKLISILLIIVVILIIIYVLICTINYYKTHCYQKKKFLSYLFDFNNSNVCIAENAPPPQRSQSQQSQIIKRDSPIINKPIVLKKDVSKLSGLFGKKEVFHIGNQDYTYDQSRCKCSSYGSRLATKNEVTQSYNNGANWCTYGWTEGQNAFYPVQKCYHDSLHNNSENDENNENNKDKILKNSDKYCGKPGINGGFFSNPKLKFGVNCYGVKPKGSIIKPKQDDSCPKKSFCELNNNFQASHKLETDEIIGFNNDKWNMDLDI